MTTLLNKITQTVSSFALFCIGGVMALIGFATIMTLALFAMLAAGVALLAAPFVVRAAQREDDTVDAPIQEDTATV